MAVAPADRLELRPLQPLLLAPPELLLLLLAPVVAHLLDRLVQAAHALQEHQRPGAVRLAGRAQPADHADLRQRTRHQTLLAQGGPAGLLQGPVEQHRRRQGHAREEVRGTRVPQAARRVHPVEPGRGEGEGPHEYPRAERRVTVAGLAHREDGAEHRRPVEPERDQVLPAVAQAEVLLAEADQTVEGERRGDRGTAEEQDVGEGAVEGLLAPAALLHALPRVVRARVLPRGTLAAREHRHRRQHAQEQHGARKQPVQRYVGQSHLGSLAVG